KDGKNLIDYYSRLFGWEIDANNPMGYGVVQRDGNTNADGAGIGGGVAGGPEGYEGHVMFYIEVPDVEAGLAKAEGLGGSRVMGHFKCSGTQRGEWRGQPATGRGFERIDEIYIFKVEDGKLAGALAGVEDNVTRMRQLGTLD